MQGKVNELFLDGNIRSFDVQDYRMCDDSSSCIGSGFPEVIYQRSLAIEFEKAGIEFEREIDQTVYYDGHVVGKRRADFIVEEEILIEIKSRAGLEPTHFAQIKNYLVAYDFEIGLLIISGKRAWCTKGYSTPA